MAGLILVSESDGGKLKLTVDSLQCASCSQTEEFHTNVTCCISAMYLSYGGFHIGAKGLKLYDNFGGIAYEDEAPIIVCGECGKESSYA